VVPRDELLSRVWNYRVDLNLNSRTVDTHVTRLRRKLQKAVGTDAAVIVAVADRLSIPRGRQRSCGRALTMWSAEQRLRQSRE
jgi:hypothetical protein